MLKKKELFSLFILLVMVGCMLNTIFAEGETHLRITPGIIEIHDVFSKGTHKNVYTYTLKNASSEKKTVHLSATGYLALSKKKVTLKPHESTSFTLSIVVPKNPKEGKHVDYVQAKTNHQEGMTSLTLAAKVTYHVQPDKAWYNSLFPSSWANGSSPLGKALHDLSVTVSSFITCIHLFILFLLLVVGWVIQRFRYHQPFSLYGHVIWWLLTFAAWLISCVTMFFVLTGWGVFVVAYRFGEKERKKRKQTDDAQEDDKKSPDEPLN